MIAGISDAATVGRLLRDLAARLGVVELVAHRHADATQSGVETATTDASGDVTVGFDVSFVTPPTVVATRVSTASTASTVAVTGVSTTGFTVRCFSSAGTAQASTSVTIGWIAHGSTGNGA